MSRQFASVEHSMESLYLTKARKAIKDDDLHAAVVYLSHVHDWTHETVALALSAAYELWARSSFPNVQPNLSIDFVAPSIRSEHESQLSMNCYARILKEAAVAELVSAWDYVRLSHIYIMEGNLDGALMICSLASARGHLENIDIITQSYFILHSLHRLVEARNYLRYMVTYVVGSVPEVQTRPHMLGVMIYIAIYLSDLDNVGDELIVLCEHIQRHCSQMGIKFNSIEEVDDNLVFSIAQDLLSSPFVLIGEELLFVRLAHDPLSNILASTLIQSASRRFNSSDIGSLLVRILDISILNLHARCCAKLACAAGIIGDQWLRLIEVQENSAIAIQKRVRGGFLRARWNTLKRDLEIARNHNLQLLQHESHYYRQTRTTIVRRAMGQWQTMLKKQRDSRLKACVRLQAFLRCCAIRLKFRDRLMRISRANGLFYFQHLVFNEQTRLKFFRRWHLLFMVIKRRNAANIICDVMMINGYNQLLVKGMSVVLGVMRIGKVHLLKRKWYTWIAHYRLALKRRAKVSIRFFLRRCLFRTIKIEADSQLVAIEENIKNNAATKFRSNQLKVIHKYWMLWAMALDRIRNARHREHAVICLQSRYRRSKSHATILGSYRRKESQDIYLRRCKLNTKQFVLTFWRRLRSARVIQCSIRCWLSRKRVQSRTIIYCEIYRRQNLLCARLKKKILRSWKIYIFYIKKLNHEQRKIKKIVFSSWSQTWSMRNHLEKRTRQNSAVQMLVWWVLKKLWTSVVLRITESGESKREKGLQGLIRNSRIQRCFRRWRLFRMELHVIDWSVRKKSMLWLFSSSSISSIDYCVRARFKIALETWKSIFNIHRQQRLMLSEITSNMSISTALDLGVGFVTAIGRVQHLFRNRRKRHEGDLWFRLLRILQEKHVKTHAALINGKFDAWKSMFFKRNLAKQIIVRFVESFWISRRHSHKRILLLAKFNLVRNNSRLKREYFFMWLKAFLLMKSPSLATESNWVINTDFDGECFDVGSGPTAQFVDTFAHISKTGTFICTNDLSLSYAELSCCVYHAKSLFLCTSDRSILTAIIRHFRGNKLVLWNFVVGSEVLNFLRILRSTSITCFEKERIFWPILEKYDRDCVAAFQLSLIALTMSTTNVFSLLSMLTSPALESGRRITSLEINPSSIGTLGTYLFFLVLPQMQLLSIQVWSDSQEAFCLLHYAWQNLKYCQQLEEFRFQGSFSSACLSALSTALFEGLPELKVMELAGVDSSLAKNELMDAVKYRSQNGRTTRISLT